jgi:hypothetical protein
MKLLTGEKFMNAKLATLATSLCVSPALLLSSMQSERPVKKSEKEILCAEHSPHPQRVEVKHIESKGVGYNQGYSTLEGFFTLPYTLDDSWVPFLDIRGHIFNDGKLAVNGGIGVRYLTDSRVWGLNTYYDYRKTRRFHYNQIGFGFESLGEIWDFRLNAYVPVGKKESDLFDTHFHDFKKHSIILSSKREIAMKGANAEVAAHVVRYDNYKLYTAVGPYYFENEGKVAWGGEGRIQCTLFDYVRLQLSGSYDALFHGIVQGEAAFTYSFGGKREIKSHKNSPPDDCARKYMIQERALQRIDRNEIVVVTNKRKKSLAINPSTGTPYPVWFVNNTSHSQGTYESPFNTLSAAEAASGPGDIIYVFTGDGTDTGMNSGLILQEGQQLLGAGIHQNIATTLGTVKIPAHDTGLPVISNANDPTTLGIQLSAGNNVISGFNLRDTLGSFNGTIYSGIITILNGSNYLIQNNRLSTTNLGSCINVYGPGDQTSIVNNVFISMSSFNFTDGVFFYDILTPITGSFYIANNLFTGSSDSTGFNNAIGTFDINQPLTLASNVAVTIASNTFVSQTNTAGTSSAIIWTAGNGSANIVGNYIDISEIVNPLAGIYVQQEFASGFLSVSLANNTSITTPPVLGYLFDNSSGNPAALQVNFAPSNIGTRSGP